MCVFKIIINRKKFTIKVLFIYFCQFPLFWMLVCLDINKPNGLIDQVLIAIGFILVLMHK